MTKESIVGILFLGALVVLVLVVVSKIFGSRLRRVNARFGYTGVGIDLHVGEDPAAIRSQSQTSRPISGPSQTSVNASYATTELPGQSIEPEFMSDEYQTRLLARLQMSVRPGDYLVVQDFTIEENSDK
jgi:hypothetical protein